jgi:hypothetical protein
LDPATFDALTRAIRDATAPESLDLIERVLRRAYPDERHGQLLLDLIAATRSVWESEGGPPPPSLPRAKHEPFNTSG